MGVTLIISAAAAAIIALTSYRRAQERDAERLNDNMQNFRQSTSVILAIGNAIWAVLDALQLLFRPSRFSSTRQIGQRASEVIIDET